LDAMGLIHQKSIYGLPLPDIIAYMTACIPQNGFGQAPATTKSGVPTQPDPRSRTLCRSLLTMRAKSGAIHAY